MKKFLKMLPYLLVNAVIFYLLPIIIKNTGTAMLVMLIAIPALCFATAIVYSIKNSFQWIYPILVAFLFAPTIFIFYNYTAWIYIIEYGLIALIGCFIGKLFYKSSK